MMALMIGGPMDGGTHPADTTYLCVDTHQYQRDWIWSTAHKRKFFFYLHFDAKPPLAKDVLARMVAAGIAWPVS